MDRYLRRADHRRYRVARVAILLMIGSIASCADGPGPYTGEAASGAAQETYLCRQAPVGGRIVVAPSGDAAERRCQAGAAWEMNKFLFQNDSFPQ
ncbi:MAG TPA: hypothetical protein VF342_06440 [Alphaproteobacteria bacterium]